MVKKTSIEGLLIIEMPDHSDERGFFREVFHVNEIEEVLRHEFKPLQMNHARSNSKVLRGIHAENWNKLIYPVNGEVFAVILDIRVDSPTFSKFETFTIDDSNRIALFISKGLANSYVVIGKDIVEYIYLVDRYYDGSPTKAIAYDDPDLNINWPISDPIISERDRNSIKLRELFPDKYK